ncbi:MAG: c-type cytochrome [Vicinamibacterales bacterium]
MSRRCLWCVAVLVTMTPLAMTSGGRAQQNGEARATVPTVVREEYDMRTFMAPLALTETELKGRALVAQRCANCHGGAPPRNPGPLLGRETVEKRGEAFIREKVRKGSPVMPGFEYTLEPAQIDQIVAFLKTFTPSPRGQAAAQD